MSKIFSKQNKNLLLLKPINIEVSVDTFFTNLVRKCEEKWIWINHSNTLEKGVKEWKKLTHIYFIQTQKVVQKT